MCDDKSIANALAAMKKAQHWTLDNVLADMLIGKYGFKMYCATTTGYFKGTADILKYRLGYAPDRRKDNSANQLDWTRLNFNHSDLHFPFGEMRDLLSQAAFKQDIEAWRPETILRRGELPGGMRECVDWRFIGGIPPCANGRVLIRSRRRFTNYKPATQCGSTCEYTGERNSISLARCAELGELSREPLLGNIAYQAPVMYQHFKNAIKGVPTRTYINVYRTLDNRDNYIWTVNYVKNKTCQAVKQNKTANVSFYEIKTDPTTKEVLNKDYALSSDDHNYVYQSDAPDSSSVNRAFVAHVRPTLISDLEPAIDESAYTSEDSALMDDRDYPLMKSTLAGRAFSLKTGVETQVGRSASTSTTTSTTTTTPDWSEPNNKWGIALAYYINEYEVDPYLKPYVDSRYIPTKNAPSQTVICGGESCFRDSGNADYAKILGYKLQDETLCGTDTSVPLLYLKCFDGESWFPFQASFETNKLSELQSYFGSKIISKNRPFFNGVSMNIDAIGVDVIDRTVGQNQFWMYLDHNQPVFTLGDLAYASPMLFVMLMLDNLGPMMIKRGKLIGGSSSLWEAMAETLGIQADEANKILYPEYLMDGSGSKTDLAVRNVLQDFHKAVFAESYATGYTSEHTPALVGYMFHPTAPDQSFFMLANSHFQTGDTYRGFFLYRIPWLHAWHGLHNFERDFGGWNHNIKTGKGGGGMAVKYFYDGTCQLPGDHATRDGGEFMGDTNEVRGASKYRLIETVDYDPSGKTAGFVGNGKDQHCNAGSPCDPIDSSVVPPLLPNYTAARALTRTNADPEADFVSYSYTTCGSASGKLLKKEAVTNQVDAVSKCTGECNFVNIKDTEGYFYASCDIENDDTGSTLLQRKSTIATQSTSMQLIEKYYGDYQDVCMTKAMKGINDFSNLIKVPSGYRLVNGPGCTSGGTTSKQKSLINCAKKCTGDCSHATWNAQTEECRVCTGTYSPTQRGPCDLITVRPIPRGAAPNVSASDYKGFNAVIGHFCENRGYTNSIAVVSGAKTMQACANACLENTLCNFAQLDESGLCALLDVCPEYYPTDNDDLQVLVRTDFTTPTASIPETGDTSTSIDDSGTDNRSYTERLNALSFVPLIVTIFLVVPLIVVLIKVVPKKLQDPRHILLARILIGTLIGCLGVIGIALSTTLILGDIHVVADAAAKQYTGVH